MLQYKYSRVLGIYCMFYNFVTHPNIVRSIRRVSMDKFNKFLDVVYKDGAWDIAVIVALFVFVANLIAGVI